MTKLSLSRDRFIFKLLNESAFPNGVKYQSFILTAPNTSIFHIES